MKNFNFQAVEVLSIEELAAVKGGHGIPTPIVIPDNPAEEALSNVSAFSLLTVSTVSGSHHGSWKHRK